eukprot:jgi/Chlat1/3604/Chrsp234S03585
MKRRREGGGGEEDEGDVVRVKREEVEEEHKEVEERQEVVQNGGSGHGGKRKREAADDDDDAVTRQYLPACVKQEDDTGDAAEAVPVSVKQEVDHDQDDEEEEERRRRRARGVAARRDCPYLDTINRSMLDFDFEKFCSVSLSNLNVYGCLVCGKYFQGRGKSSHAYTHALEAGHHVFINLHSEKVYCLPDGYEVDDPSLDDIRHVLHPSFNSRDISSIDSNKLWSRTLDGTDYLPGTIGLNNLNFTDYVNVIVQALMRVTPVRDFFLTESNYVNCKSLLVQRFGELCRKIWHPRNFKGQVSPHEFLQAMMMASEKKYRIGNQSDPVEFASWLLNALHHDLGGTKKHNSSVIYQCFQGELEVTTERSTSARSVDKEAGMAIVKKLPFLMLGLDLPPPPLFKDVMEKNIIPQVPLYTILKKFDGETITEQIREGKKRFRITRLPKYLVLYMKRFTKNNFFIEKNPTIVNFPVKNLELKDYIPVPTDKQDKTLPSKYDLIANICHDGKPKEGTYRVQVFHKAEEIWYDIQDLHVSETLPQMVALSETYMQIYELKSSTAQS